MLDAVDPVDFRELPEEAKLWPKSVLERFRLTGQQPPWSSDPGTEALMLDEPSELQVEANLRTAALWLSRCAALVVVAGEGMAEVLELDSGARGGAAWPGLAELGRSLDQMMTTRCFREEPELAWDCWRHYLRRFRDAELHAGYRSALFGEPPLGTFVLSTAWDGLWAAAGAKVHEVCGSPQELRCCGAWPLPEDVLEPGAAPPLCRCGQVALPGVRLLDEAPSAACSELEGFLARVRGELLVLELGCKPGSEGRRRAEALAGHGPPGCTTRLLRVQRRFCALPQALRSSGCGVPLRCREALKRVEALLPFTGLGSFIFQDSSGSGGAEVRAPKDGPLGFAFRKALAADSRRQEDVDVAQLMFKANSVLREHRVADVAPDNAVPEEMFFQERDATPPVVRVFVINFTFHQKNDLLQQRVSRVWSLVKDLVEVYSTEEYRKNFEATSAQPSAA
ncbi:unnamed protein product [Effrenium voratum]|uniref:Uncharacterized protein n=1 Tax=Effrenium voratum TaxID=2562239 RepID=A0AA36NGN1_9DINO|nr:unnamed protein product [Effrenium voratum]